MTRKVYLQTLKSVLGSSISHYFPELVLSLRQNKLLVHKIHGDRKINTDDIEIHNRNDITQQLVKS